MEYYFGVDFGTTNSALVCYALEGKRRQAIRCDDGTDRPIPSTVAIDREGKIFVGRAAWQNKMRLRDTCRYFHSIKTILDSDDEFEVAGKMWTPVDIASEVFSHLRRLARKTVGVDMTEAFLSIPIGFSAQKRIKLRQAAAKAGIDVKSFVSEPTAAFAANYDELKSASTVAIFDWGGGTLDVSIIGHSGGNLFEIATAGMSLAGDDLDRKLAEKIHDKLARKKKISIAFADMPSGDQDTMLVKAEEAKREFTFSDDAQIMFNRYGELGACREMLGYDWFEEIIKPEVSSAIDCFERTIQQSGVGLANVDRIVMIGGSSNLRPLIEQMERRYGEKLFFPEETMWSVGQGTARLSLNAGDYYSNQSLGLILSDGSYYELLKRGAAIKGWSCECNFGVVDTTEQARFVFASREGFDGSKLLNADYMTLSVPNYQFLQEQIVLRCGIDDDLIFKATAASNMRGSQYARTWDYDRLKCYYRLPR